MNVHVLTGTEITTGRRKLPEIVAEYEAKRAALPEVLEAFTEAQKTVTRATSLGGVTWGRGLDLGSLYERSMAEVLLVSAWRYVYDTYGIGEIASAKDKQRFEGVFASPPPFDMDNLFEVFGDIVRDPRQTILRGLAEVFSDLDPAFKSHEKMKIGVKGLPKRVIVRGISDYGGYGDDKLRDIINALAALQGLPLVTHAEMSVLRKNGTAMLDGGEFADPHQSRYEKPKTFPIIRRGIELRRYQNGNGHIYFAPDTLKAINLGLAEFYGDVLPDCPEERPALHTGTDVAKDLQFYRTPAAVARRLVSSLYSREGRRVLEPSCGDGAILDTLREEGWQAQGIEVDGGRADAARAKCHAVLTANFLDFQPTPEWSGFDAVAMNPPFYGKHYEKHIRHALKFLRPGGTLVAILPATARYDHGLLADLKPRWEDLPVGSFSESGTNVNTCIAVIREARG